MRYDQGMRKSLRDRQERIIRVDKGPRPDCGIPVLRSAQYNVTVSIERKAE